MWKTLFLLLVLVGAGFFLARASNSLFQPPAQAPPKVPVNTAPPASSTESPVFTATVLAEEPPSQLEKDLSTTVFVVSVGILVFCAIALAAYFFLSSSLHSLAEEEISNAEESGKVENKGKIQLLAEHVNFIGEVLSMLVPTILLIGLGSLLIDTRSDSLTYMGDVFITVGIFVLLYSAGLMFAVKHWVMSSLVKKMIMVFIPVFVFSAIGYILMRYWSVDGGKVVLSIAAVWFVFTIFLHLIFKDYKFTPKPEVEEDLGFFGGVRRTIEPFYRFFRIVINPKKAIQEIGTTEEVKRAHGYVEPEKVTNPEEPSYMDQWNSTLEQVGNQVEGLRQGVYDTMEQVSQAYQNFTPLQSLQTWYYGDQANETKEEEDQIKK